MVVSKVPSRATVIGVHNPPGLEVRDDLLDHVSNLVYLSVELSSPSPEDPGTLAS